MGDKKMPLHFVNNESFVGWICKGCGWHYAAKVATSGIAFSTFMQSDFDEHMASCQACADKKSQQKSK